jgi:hypothetical protein
MEEVSLVELKKRFGEMVGFRASAPIFKEGALRSSGIIVEVEKS